MAPKKNSGTVASPTSATTSPRKTRSQSAGKRPPPPAAKPAAKKSKKTDAVVSKKKNQKETNKVEVGSDEVENKAGAVIIEACKQCNSFKTRAITVKEGLESAISGIEVTINPDKPRRGYFEVRSANGEVFISLPDMKRPFKPMKDLDMERVVNDIVAKIKDVK